MNITNAEHAETAPEAEKLVISKLVCSLVGRTETITFSPGSLASKLYTAQEAQENFACNFGVNPDYSDPLFQGALKAAGFGPDGEVRLVELEGHPFFIGTLFLPQVNSSPGRPHPLICGFVRAL